MQEPMLVLVSFIFLIVGALMLVKGFQSYKQYRLIKDIPRSTVRSLAMGIVEIHGRVKQAEKLLVSPFSKVDCVYFKYKIEERRRKGGKRPSTYWATIGSGKMHVPFLAEDETGTVLVNPTEAEFNTELRREYRHKGGFFGGFQRLFDSLSNWGSGNSDDLSDLPIDELEEVDPDSFFSSYSVGDRRYREYYLCNAEPLFVIGTAAVNNADNSIVIERGENNPTYIIGDRSEEGMLKELRKTYLSMTGLSLLLIVIGLFIVLKELGLF
jgi:hypothetical protein